SPLDEERREAGELLQPMGARAGDRALRRALQSPPVSRGAAQRDAGRRVSWAPGGDPLATRTDQTRYAQATKADESTSGVGGSTCWRCVSYEIGSLVWITLTTYSRVPLEY